MKKVLVGFLLGFQMIGFMLAAIYLLEWSTPYVVALCLGVCDLVNMNVWVALMICVFFGSGIYFILRKDLVGEMFGEVGEEVGEEFGDL